MRIVVHGLGAVGGTVAAALALAGHEVAGVARGRQLEAVQAAGLRLRTPAVEQVARFACAASPAELALRPDDAVVLAVKTQDTTAALDQLAAAGLGAQPVFCAQNGVENERMALRRFPNVHGIAVMLPADFVVPGEVAAFGAPRHAIFDIGRYPRGDDADDAALAQALDGAGIASFVTPAVMQSKYGKLLMNLSNVVEAALGAEADAADLKAVLRVEGEAVLRAAGLSWRDVGAADLRRDALMQIRPIEGVRRTGSSSTQSLVRGAGSIETDYLNGEIVLLGRLHGVPTPANDWFAAMASRMVREQLPAGSIALADARHALGL